ncbi:sigma-70 family RNA polymerase sigma factor [Kineococcus sp. T13]|nr:sigma-70 family RNA polymerase sigma factor [Kineococcus vitellinus]
MRTTPPGAAPDGAHPDERTDERTDEVLARRAALGDRDAFGVLVDRHGPALYRYAVRLLDERGQADDCLQDALLAAWRGLPSFRGDASVRTWLFTIVRHEVHARSRRRAGPGGAAPVDAEEVLERIRDVRQDPERTSVQAALREALDLALRLLPPRQRSAWLLREVEELSYEEIAQVLGTTSTAVRGLLERARTTLAATLEDWR